MIMLFNEAVDRKPRSSVVVGATASEAGGGGRNFRRMLIIHDAVVLSKATLTAH